MRAAARVCIATLALVTLPFVASAQKAEWTIVRFAGDTLSECSLQRLDDSLLTVVYKNSTVSIPVDIINVLSRHKESGFWTGAEYGGAIGFATGSAVGVVDYHDQDPTLLTVLNYIEPGLKGAVIGGAAVVAIGGIIGLSFGGDDIHQLYRMTRAQKLAVIRSIIVNEARR